MTRTHFHVDIIASDEPMVTDNYYKWLQSFDPLEIRKDSTLGTIDKYLESLGFDIKQHKVDGHTADHLKYIRDHFWENWMPYPDKVYHLNEVLRPSTDSDAFTLWGTLNQRYKPTDELRKILEVYYLIYTLHPNHFYFQIIRDRLYIKYQTIIGSRLLCHIKPTE